MAAICVGLASCQPSPDGLSDADVSAIRASSAEWVATYNKNDWTALAELFAPDASMMPPNSPEAVGRDAIAAWEAASEEGFRIALDVQQIDGRGDMAVVRGRSCVFIPKESGGYGVDVGKFLEVRRKQAAGNWLIVSDIFNSDLALGSELQDACPFAELG
tara:strand:- start:173 stop:652 length:480 start_codon:yes stop_codon:yes gene_type:complete